MCLAAIVPKKGLSLLQSIRLNRKEIRKNSDDDIQF